MKLNEMKNNEKEVFRISNQEKINIYVCDQKY